MKTERRKVWIAQLLILIISFVGKFLSESSLTASCKDVSVIEGQNINLTCTFSENVERLDKDFKIELHSESHDTPFPLLLCHWSQYQTRDCYEHEGYSYVGHEGNTVKLNIHKASLDDNGKYACVLLSHSRPGTYKLCSLTVQAPKGVSLSTPILLNGKVSPANDKSDPAVEDKGIFGSIKWSLILGALMVLIIILLIIVIILFIKSRRASKTGDKRNEQGPEGTPLKS